MMHRIGSRLKGVRMIIRQVLILAIFLTSMNVSKGMAQTTAPPNPSSAAPSQYPSTSDSESVIETLQRKISSLQAHLQDWPDLVRYRADDAIVLLTTPDQQRVVFLGDSIFDGWRHPIRSFPWKPYTNRGIGGLQSVQRLIKRSIFPMTSENPLPFTSHCRTTTANSCA
jgi:hypothetical protein